MRFVRIGRVFSAGLPLALGVSRPSAAGKCNKRGEMFDRVNQGDSCWAATAQMPSFPTIDRSFDIDVAVIGGGVAGITAAHLLKQAGVRVALLEACRCGSGQTGRSTAHATSVADVPFVRLVERLGPDRARAMWDAGFAALARIRAEIRDARIHCGFAWVRGCLHAADTQRLADARVSLAQEATIANALGIDAAYVDHVPGIVRPGVWFDGQARLHPLRYLSVLLERIDGDGCFVFEHSPVDAIDPDRMTVRCGAHTVSARYIVVATHLPLPSALPSSDVVKPAVHLTSTYVVSGRAPHGQYEEGLYWEHCDAPYEYLRIDRDGAHDLIIAGGFDHAGADTTAAPDRFARLERRLAQRVAGLRIDHRWSGTIVESVDGRPHIGEVQPGVFIATGFGGNGMTYGTLAGMMAVDAARGARSPWADLFDPRRRSVLAGPWRELASSEAS